MADILLKRDSDLNMTSIPNTFIDDYMTHANGEFVKIYLYLLRCMNYPDTPFSISATADKFEQPESDVRRALKYWEKLHLLRLEFNAQNEVTEICLLDTNSAYPNPPVQYPENKVPEKTVAFCAPLDVPDHADDNRKPPDKAMYTKDQLSKFCENETVQEIFFVAESYMGHPLGSTEIQTILYWLDELHFSQNLIEYLLETCVGNGHTSIYYMDKIALAWAEQGICQPGQAKHSQEAHSSLSRKVQRAFGISGRNLVKPELAYMKRWSEDYGFSDEIIVCACERTINRIHQVNFDYTESILSNWRKHHVCTLKDVELLDAQYKEARKNQTGKAAGGSHTATGTTVNHFTDISQRTYDYDALERELLLNH